MQVEVGISVRGTVDGAGGAVDHHPAGEPARLHGLSLVAIAVVAAHRVCGPPLQRTDGLPAGGRVDALDLGGDLLGRIREERGLRLRQVQGDVSTAVADLHAAFEEGDLDLLGVPYVLQRETCRLGHRDGFADVHRQVPEPTCPFAFGLGIPALHGRGVEQVSGLLSGLGGVALDRAQE